MTRVDGVRYTDALEAYPDKVDGERLLRPRHHRHPRAHDRLRHLPRRPARRERADQRRRRLLAHRLRHRRAHRRRAAGRDGAVPRSASAATTRVLQLRGPAGLRRGARRARTSQALARQLEAQLDAIDPALRTREKDVTVDELGQLLGAIIRVLASNGFRLPKELVLFFKNLLYLNGFAAALAPDANLFEQIEPVFGYFVQRYPNELSQIVARHHVTLAARAPWRCRARRPRSGCRSRPVLPRPSHSSRHRSSTSWSRDMTGRASHHSAADEDGADDGVAPQLGRPAVAAGGPQRRAAARS